MQTTVRKNLPVSTFSIINQFTTVFLLIIGLTAFKEQLLLTKLIGIGFILAANFLLVYKKEGIKIDKNTWLGILATLTLAIAISVDIGISKQFNLPFYIMLTLFIPAIMLFSTEKIKINEIKTEFQSETKKYYLLTGLAWGLAIFFSLRSFQYGVVTTIVPLQATAVLFNVLIAYVFQNEKSDKLKKIIAACLVIVGVYMTVL